MLGVCSSECAIEAHIVQREEDEIDLEKTCTKGGITVDIKILLVNVTMGVPLMKTSMVASSTGHIVSNLVVVEITNAPRCNKSTPKIGNNSTQ